MNRQQWVIAINTFRELVRTRVFLILAIFAILMTSLSTFLGEMTFGTQKRVIIDMGLAAMHIVLVILSVFVSVSFVRREIENKSVMSLLSKPLSRFDYFMGKFLGGWFLNLIFAILALSILRLILGNLVGVAPEIWFQVCLGMILEMSILLALSLFLAMVLKGFTSMATCVGIFLLGHWLQDLTFFARKSKNETFVVFADVMNWIVPNLEMFNWRSYLFVGKSASEQILPAFLHASGWVIVLLTLLVLVVRRKDIV